MTINMSSNPLVSILIPCYNVEQYLSQCLDSVVNQTYKELQIVLVDDGSMDNTLRVAQMFADVDSRIEIYHQENQGVSPTRNYLLEKIKGDYLLFVDSDDWMEPDMVEFLLVESESSDADISTCGMVINDTAVSSDFKKVEHTSLSAVERFLYHTEFRGSLWNKLVKTSLLHNERFHCGISYGEDALFCWQILKHCHKVNYTDRQLYHYRMNQTSISHSNFGAKKLSGHKVWETICADVEMYYPQFSDIAYARFALEDMYLLRDASQSGYRYGNDIAKLQKTVEQHFSKARELGIASKKDAVYAWMITHWYNFGKLYLELHKLLRH